MAVAVQSRQVRGREARFNALLEDGEIIKLASGARVALKRRQPGDALSLLSAIKEKTEGAWGNEDKQQNLRAAAAESCLKRGDMKSARKIMDVPTEIEVSKGLHGSMTGFSIALIAGSFASLVDSILQGILPNYQRAQQQFFQNLFSSHPDFARAFPLMYIAIIGAVFAGLFLIPKLARSVASDFKGTIEEITKKGEKR